MNCSNEIWRKVQEIGPAAGSVYELAMLGRRERGQGEENGVKSKHLTFSPPPPPKCQPVTSGSCSESGNRAQVKGRTMAMQQTITS